MAGRSEGLPLESLWQAAGPTADGVGIRGGPLPPPLAERFPGELTIDLQADRPTVLANFVTSLDGVVSMGTGERGTGGGDQLQGRLAFVRGEIVHDHDVAGMENGYEDFLDIEPEPLAIDRAIDEPGCLEAIVPKPFSVGQFTETIRRLLEQHQ